MENTTINQDVDNQQQQQQQQQQEQKQQQKTVAKGGVVEATMTSSSLSTTTTSTTETDSTTTSSDNNNNTPQKADVIKSDTTKPATTTSTLPKSNTGTSNSAPSAPPAAPAPVATSSATASTTSGGGSGGGGSKTLEEKVSDEIVTKLIECGKIQNREMDLPNICTMIREYTAMKEKVTKLKSLLGRSAKAQRESKIECETSNKRLEHALREIDRLNKKVDHLATRPTHMELLADFEANFDKAILSVGRQQQQQQQQQTGGQDTAASSAETLTTERQQQQVMLPYDTNDSHRNNSNTNVVDNMLLQELSDSKSRIEKLESLNTALLHRATQYEKDYERIQKEYDTNQHKISNLELQLRMAQMEAQHTQRAYEEKTISLQEMQMEIDLITKASVDANKRAAQGDAIVQEIQTDKELIAKLEAQVKALQEWALASAEAKRISVERVQELEIQLRKYQQQHSDATGEDTITTMTNNPVTSADATNKNATSNHTTTSAVMTSSMPATTTRTTAMTTTERTIHTKTGSLVIGAGDVGTYIVQLLPEYVQSVQSNERFTLKWKFEILGANLDIKFAILKGNCSTSKQQKEAMTFLKHRDVSNSAAGEIDDSPFVIQNACTLFWSNEKSWVRPRTITFAIEIVAVKDIDY